MVQYLLYINILVGMGMLLPIACIVRCSARDWDRIRITWGNPQSGCSDICSYSKRATEVYAQHMLPGETPV
jgi:hypothetical protein